MSLIKALAAVPNGKGAVSADLSGKISELVGSIDGDAISTVVATSLPTLEAAGNLLGLGDVESCCIVSSASALYLYSQPKGFVVVSGLSSKDPEAVLKKLAGD